MNLREAYKFHITYFKTILLSNIELSSQFEKKLVVIYVWVHFGLRVALTLFVYSMPYHTTFKDYCCFMLSLEIRTVGPPILISYSRSLKFRITM